MKLHRLCCYICLSIFLYACATDQPQDDLKDTIIGEEMTNEKQNTESPFSKKSPEEIEDIESYFAEQDKEKARADVPSYEELLSTSSIYMQDKITPAKRSEAVVEYLAEKNDKALISLKLLKDNTFQVQSVFLQEDIPLILVGAYLSEGDKYYLQFTDSDFCRKFFDPSVNKNPSVEMLSSSELEFPKSLKTINIFGIPCHKQ